MRVIGIDPGTVSFDICGLDGDEVFVDGVFPSADLGADPSALVDAVRRCLPLDLVVGPSGYGLPWVRGEDVGERELSQMLLVRADESKTGVGIGGMRGLIRALIGTGAPLVFAPGVIHLPSVPAYRKANRIDMGTADKVCSVAQAIAEQALRFNIGFDQTSFIMLELGGAFSAALAVAGGAIVDGAGGSSGPMGFRAGGAMDGEAAYLLGAGISKDTIFSGGARDIAGEAGRSVAFERWQSDARLWPAWLAWIESIVKAALAMTVAEPQPREIILSGRMSQLAEVVSALSERLAPIAPVRVLSGLQSADGAPLRSKSAAQGAALIANGLLGGRYAALVEAMQLRDASGSVLDHLHLRGAAGIRLG